MAWIQILVDCPKESIETVEETFWELGALAVTLRDAKENPLFEPTPNTTPLWPIITVSALFDAETDLSTLKASLKEASLNGPLNQAIFDSLQFEPFEDKNWIQTSLDQFSPLKFGQHLWICPSWCEMPEAFKADANNRVIVLDPGLAFGTGTHATTALCLEWLDQHPPQHLTVIDYGCGSGILSIAALKLGAKEVFAVDYDPQALLSTENNAKLNQLSSSLFSILPETLPLYLIDKKADIILANILADPILELIPQFTHLLKPGGQLILSGILEKQKEAIVNALQPHFNNIEVVVKEEWVRINGLKN